MDDVVEVFSLEELKTTSNRPQWSIEQWGMKPYRTGELLYLNYKDMFVWRNLRSYVRTTVNSCSFSGQ